MKLPTLSLIFFGFLLIPSLHAESLSGNDGAVYGTSVNVDSEKRSGDTYATVTGRVLVNAALDAPINVILDTDAVCNWVYSCIDSGLITAQGLNDQTLHLVFSAPSPFKARDGYIRFHGKGNGSDLYNLKMTQVSGAAASADHVRVKDLRGAIKLEALADGKTGIEFQIHIDPSIKPVFAANMNTVKLVKSTLKSLKKYAEGAYKNQALSASQRAALGL